MARWQWAEPAQRWNTAYADSAIFSSLPQRSARSTRVARSLPAFSASPSVAKAAGGILRPMLSLREKYLYHQIHPWKLAVDISGGLASTWLVWRRELWIAAVVAFVPSIVVSVVMLRWMDFSRQRDSGFGRYVAYHMTRIAEAVRSAGQIVMWVGAWFHAVWAIVAGAVVIVLGWTYSLPSWRSQTKRP